MNGAQKIIFRQGVASGFFLKYSKTHYTGIEFSEMNEKSIKTDRSMNTIFS
jgi:hypothetical protein